MTILNRLFGKKQQKLEYKSTGVSISPDSFLAFSLTGSVSNLTPVMAYEYYRTSSAVATSVDLIAEEVEQMQPVLVHRSKGVIQEHPLLDLLRDPNPAEDYRTFIGALARNWLITRTAPIGTKGNVKFAPVEMWAVKPQHISTIENGVDGYPASYLVTTGPCQNSYNRSTEKRNWRYLANELAELYRISGFSSQSGSTHPDSPLLAAALEIRQQINGRVHNAKLLENGARLSLIAVMKDSVSPEEHESRKHLLNQQISGASNAGKVAVISSEDMELKEVGTSNKDMDYANLDKISSQAVFLRYKIPLPLVTTDNSTYNNMNSAKFDLYDRAVIPTFNVLAQGISQCLFPRMGLDLNEYTLTYDAEKITAVRGRMLEELKLKRDLNLETTNELRASLPDREPVEGGGVLYQSATLIPVGLDTSLDDVAKLDEDSRANAKG